MLSFDQVQAKIEKSVSIIRRPHAKHGLVMREFGKIAKTLGRWVHPPDTICMAGCHHCCFRMPVLKSKLEFDFVASEAKFAFIHTGPWMRKYQDKWTKFSEIFGPTSEATLDAWRGAKIPCPMLNLEDRKCAIYECRPIECRIRWAPQFFLADCFPGSPRFHMLDGPAQASSFEMSDPLVQSVPPRAPKTPIQHMIENLLRDIDKWTFNFVGKPRPLLETIELLSAV
jgi:Fe-S-cluster containining protein